MSVVVAIDAGTTGVRAFAVSATGEPIAWAYREFPQYFPQPGWVEHDPLEIWDTTISVLQSVVVELTERGETVATIGIANQRETVVVWDRITGQPRHSAIVWQDRRTAGRCDELRADGHEPLIRKRTGLVLDPYFSGTKLAWLLREGGIQAENMMFGTVDTWLLWKLTGGLKGGVHATDPSNASRTMLYDIERREWSGELCALIGVPMNCLATVMPSSGRFGMTDPDSAAGLRVAVSGIAGDQQAALFGQACFEPGMTKNTYGTGSFVLTNVGAQLPDPVDGLLTTVAWELSDGTFAYAMEGAIFATGAGVQWLRDGLAIIDAASEMDALAASVESTDGVYCVPAFTGLGSPWWDPYARATIVGITRGTTRAHLARAVGESMAYQTRDVVDAIKAASGTALAELRIDGGASAMDVMCQFQADLLGVTVRRAAVQETTALGAAYLAGIAEDIWPTPAAAANAWRADATFYPTLPIEIGDAMHGEWRRAVDRSRAWAS